MIITQLSGGLGNQMFQYAMGRAISLSNASDLLIDLSIYGDKSNHDTKREYELNIFNLPISECTTSDKVRLGEANPIILKINSIFHTKIDPYPSTLIRESSHQFKPELLDLKGNYYLQGFWQSEKYFMSFRETLLRDFKFKRKLSGTNLILAKGIQNSNSVSIHVRRGDYVSNPNTNSFHGVCDISYYQKAVSYLNEKLINPKYYIFSDDPTWCKKNLKFDRKTTYVSNNSNKNSWEDMRLMSLCKHHIIANSSFSWWGAWLDQNPEKIVISPKKWFNNSEVKTTDLLPETWIKI